MRNSFSLKNEEEKLHIQNLSIRKAAPSCLCQQNQGKVLCTILLVRLRNSIDSRLREEQAGFRPGRSCTEQIFTLRNVIEQCIEFQKPLSLNFIDFKKAFESVHRESL